MTSYISITNAEIDPNSPITSDLMTKMRDNPVAITEGATGAPRIVGPAMYSPVAGAIVQRNCLPFGTVSASSNTSTPSVNQIMPSVFTALVACTVRVNLTFAVTGTSGALNIRKNATIVQTYTTNQTNVTVDITLAAGDCIGVEVTGTGTSGGATGTGTVTLLKYDFDARSAVMT